MTYTMRLPVSYADSFCSLLSFSEINYRIKDERDLLTLANTDDSWTLLFNGRTELNKAKQMLAMFRFCANHAQYTELLCAIREEHGLVYGHKQCDLWSIECTTTGKSISVPGTFAVACCKAREFCMHEVTIWLQPESAKVAHLDQFGAIHMIGHARKFNLTEAICSGRYTTEINDKPASEEHYLLAKGGSDES